MRVSTFPAVLLVVLSSSNVFAHGNETHAKVTFDPAKAEQQVFGIAGDPKRAMRVIRISMSDRMRFTPASITVKLGETVKFIVTNRGQIMHEMVIGTMKHLTEHADLMKMNPDMEHEEPHMAHVKPGTTEEIVWTFNKPGVFNFACLIPGHFEAGMLGKINVVSTDGHTHAH